MHSYQIPKTYDNRVVPKALRLFLTHIINRYLQIFFMTQITSLLKKKPKNQVNNNDTRYDTHACHLVLLSI